MAVVEPREGAQVLSGMAGAEGAGEGLCRAGSGLGECQEGWSKHLLRVKQGMQAVLDW